MITTEFLELVQQKYNEKCNTLINYKHKYNYCNLSGAPIKDNKIIIYKSGEIYLWKYFCKYIDFLVNYNNYIIEYNTDNNFDDNVLLFVNKEKKHNIKFDLTFEKSFHLYIDNSYHNNIQKFLIYGTYSHPLNTKPYITTNVLKDIKMYFSHGDIVFTGDNYYIMKNIKKTKKTWKKIDSDLNDNLTIDFEYVASRGYSYYINLQKYFNIIELPLDDKKEDYMNLIDKNIYSSDCDKYVDEITSTNKKPTPFLDVQDGENEDFNKKIENINNEYGRVIIKNDKFYIMYDKDNHIELTDNIARQFTYIRGFSYYYNICQEFDKEWKCLISPFEYINLGNMEISKIKLVK